MKKIIILFCLAVFSLAAVSQRVYFVYIQSEQEQPFYVKMNDKIYSSAAKGYLILSHLRDTNYNLTLGFPGGGIAEQKFDISLKGKDHGYLLKKFEPAGWGLFDLQTMAVINSGNALPAATAEIKKEPTVKDQSAFTQILAKAADDSTLLEKPVIVKEEKKPQPVKEEKKEAVQPEPIKQTETKIEEIKPVQGQTEKKTEVIEEKKAEAAVLPMPKEEKPVEVQNKTEVSVEVYKISLVTRKSESSTTEGFGIIYIDEYADGKRDTVRILIPPAKEIIPAENPPAVKEEKKFLDITTDAVKKEEAKTEIEAKTETTKPAQPEVLKKNNCVSTADESDFLKLRKKIAGESDADIMVAESKKAFRTKCFSTGQLKNLSMLFLNDEGKYKFFDASYNYVSDIENFPSLVSELKEEYFQNRFKAMLR